MIRNLLRQLLRLVKKTSSEFYIKNIAIAYNSLFALLGFASIFIPIDAYTGNTIPQKVITVLTLLMLPYIGGYIYSSHYVNTHHVNKRPLKNGNFIIEYGDLHELMFPDVIPTEEYTIVIPVNNRLNTVAMPWGSVGKSIHGYWLHTIISHNNIDSDTLQELCKKRLKQQHLYRSEEKYEYPIGTCILLKASEIHQPNVNILLAATGFINQENQSDGNDEIFILGVQGIIKAQRNLLYKCPLYMPIICGGFAGRNMRQTSEELIDMIYQLFKFNESGIASDIHVVVRKTDDIQIF